jgi:hypothetical protein
VGGSLALGMLIAFITLFSSISGALAVVYATTKRSLVAAPFDYTNLFGKYALRTVFPIASIGMTPTGSVKNGIALDVQSTSPIPKALVMVYSPSGNLATDVTDQNGRYNLKPKPDTYELKASHADYAFPAPADKIPYNYAHVYKPGEKIEVNQSDSAIDEYTLPMDPIQNDTSIFAKLRHFRVGYPLALISSGIVLFASYLTPNPFNLSLAGILVLYDIWKLINSVVKSR